MQRFRTEQELDELLSQPYPETIEMFRRIQGDVMLLGVGGKMGHKGREAARSALEMADLVRKV